MKKFEKLAEGEVGGQKGSEVRPQGGQVYNSKALQRLAGEPAVLNFDFPWEPVFLHVCIIIASFAVVCRHTLAEADLFSS